MSEKAYHIVTDLQTAQRAGLIRFYAPLTGTLDRIYIRTVMGPVGGNAVFDVNIDALSIWDADQTQRPKILDGDLFVDKSSIGAGVTQYVSLVTVDFDAFTGTAASVGGVLDIIIEFN